MLHFYPYHIMTIDTYVTATAFVFRQGAKEVGRAPYETLVLAPAKGASESDITDMGCELAEYTAGEAFKHPAAGEIVLGPKREFTHEVTLDAVGNPDTRQYARLGPKKTVRCISTEEAVEVVKAYQYHYEMGGGNCSKEHGVVWELPKGGKGKRKKVGEVNYGGRYWTVAEKAKWEAELKAKYATT